MYKCKNKFVDILTKLKDIFKSLRLGLVITFCTKTNFPYALIMLLLKINPFFRLRLGWAKYHAHQRHKV